MAATPSGEQFELALGDQRAVVTEVGAGLRAYSAGGREVLDGYPADALAELGPWPAADPVAEPDPRRRLPARRPRAPAAAERARARERDPRARALVELDGGRPGRRPRRPRARAAPAAGLPVHAGAAGRVLARRTTGSRCGRPRRTRAPSRARTGPAPIRTSRSPAGRRGGAPRSRPRTVLESDERGIPVGSSPVDGELDFRAAAPGRQRAARPLLHRPRARRGRPGARRARRDDALGRRELPVPDGLHRRRAPRGRAAQEHRRRADDLRAERLRERRRPGRARAGRRRMRPRGASRPARPA